MIAINKRILGIVMAVILLLSIPLLAMQFTNQVNWTLADFVVAGGLLLIFGFIIEFILQKVKKSNHRIGIVLALLTVLILIWMELAVGIFGTPFSGS